MPSVTLSERVQTLLATGGERVAQLQAEAKARLAEDRLTIDRSPPPIAQAVAPHVSTPLRTGNQVDLHIDGEEAYSEIYRVVESAKQRLDLEFFSFHDDVSGRKLAQKLIQKAQSGVEVNLLVDHLANRPNFALLKRMEDAGVRVRRYSDGYRFPLLHPNTTTDHKKVILADGQVAMTGGMNIGERYERYWHDFMVTLRGPSVRDLYDRFEDNWRLSKGPALKAVTVNIAPQGDHKVQVAVTKPNQQEIKASMLAAVDFAKDRIYIQSPYFPDDDLVDRLKAASKRGVKVVVLLPTVGDNRAVDFLNKMTVNELLRAGVKVYAFDTKNPDFPDHDHITDHFNHGKVMSVDGLWTTIGTANADNRSMVMSQEVNLMVVSKDFAQEVEDRIFHRDIQSKARPALENKFSPLSWPIRKGMEALDFLF